MPEKKSSPSLGSIRWELGYSAAITHTIASDDKPREVKSAFYLHSSYEILLSTKGSFMKKSDLDITDTSKRFCRILLELEQPVPQDTLFRDDLFEKLVQEYE